MNGHNTDRSSQLAYDFIHYTNENLFVTGKAGTGKTTFLRNVQERCPKKMVVIAPTGVAAIQASGVTIHSFFQLPFGMFIRQHKPQWGVTSDLPVYNEHQLLSQLKINAVKRKLIQKLELIIIDEVSMVRSDLIDAIDAVLKFIRKNSKPFGGVQMLFIGDLFQLPPVVNRAELPALLENYNSMYFFDAQILRERPPICIEFNTIYRQSDHRFIQLLNNIRHNTLDDADYEVLQSRYFPNLNIQDGTLITLTSHNRQADEINRTALENIHNKKISFQAQVKGVFPENVYPMPEILELKEGAQVMFIKNDKGEQRRYYNGKIGKVIRLNKFDNEITIQFKNEPDTLTIQPEKWENIRYAFNEDKNTVEEEVIGSFEHFPLRLAWAVTIHKSQGMTFDEAIVNAGQSFAPGQVYVALSRLRSLEGLYLVSRITPQSIIVDNTIVAYFKKNDDIDTLHEALEFGQLQLLEKEIKAAFDFQGDMEEIRDVADKHLSDLLKPRFTGNELVQDVLDKCMQFGRFGMGFHNFIEEKFILRDWDALNERLQKAVEWYTHEIREKVIEPIDNEIEKLKLEKNTKKLTDTFHQVKVMYTHKIHALDSVGKVMGNLAYKKHIQDALQMYYTLLRQEVTVEKAPEKLPSYVVTIDLYKKHGDIARIESLRNLRANTIWQHLTRGVEEGMITLAEIMPDEKYLQILDTIKKHPQESLTTYVQKLGQAYSFEDVRMVLAHLKYRQEL